AIIAILAAMLLPALAAAKRKAQRINCVSNLKQIGLAFRLWEGDNNDKYPMTVSYKQGGAQEYVYSSGITPGTYNPSVVYMVMSNELSTPKILVCPSDTRSAATNFSVGGTYGNEFATNSENPSTNYLSYFIGGDAIDTQPQSILCGDRNIGTDAGNAGNPPTIMFTQAANGTGLGGGSGAGVPIGDWAWTSGDLHLKNGNITLGDGSVQQVSINGLVTALVDATNSTANPSLFYNFVQ
ncbi:MAG: hypothetical protein ACREC8_10740, partial [Limisphaerales bacterium]